MEWDLCGHFTKKRVKWFKGDEVFYTKTIEMKWETFLVEWGTEDQNVFLFLQWCLSVMSVMSAREGSRDTIGAWCDWSRLEVEMAPMRKPDGCPVIFTIGNRRVLDLFGVRLRCTPSPVLVDGNATASVFSAETFTHWVHAGCTTHLFQTFLRRLVTLATRERSSPIEGTLLLLCRILKKSGWVSWRCATCAALVEVIREDILIPGMEEQDPYGLRQKASGGGEASAPLSTEEWVRLLACNGRLAVGDPTPVLVAGGEARKVWVRAALAVQGETRKILEHTTQTKMRADFLDALAEAVAKEASTAPEEDRQKWMQDASSRVRAVIQQWLVTNFRFIPFSEIDFDRLSTALLIFRTAFFSESTQPSSLPPQEENGLETVEGLFQMSTLLLEPHDRSLCLGVYEKEEWKKELAICRDYHPMHRLGIV